jgi:hypothetical protein
MLRPVDIPTSLALPGKCRRSPHAALIAVGIIVVTTVVNWEAVFGTRIYGCRANVRKIVNELLRTGGTEP